MYIHVDLGTDPPDVRLEEPADCGRFHLELVDRGDQSTLGEVLTRDGVGTVDDDGNAFISIVALRALAEGRVEPHWAEDFARMIDHARSRGWLSADGTAIQAHVELVAW